jgi:hypothetical protein
MGHCIGTARDGCIVAVGDDSHRMLHPNDHFCRLVELIPNDTVVFVLSAGFKADIPEPIQAEWSTVDEVSACDQKQFNFVV